MAGKAFLVGAGPGSPDLITVRGLRLLQSANAVVHDRLVDPQLVALAHPQAEIFDVGKVSGGPSWSQADINGLLIRLAQEEKKVIRLKGGDPFVFGRGGEEQAALRKAGITVEIVPGVSSATGVPAILGVPLTHRGIAKEFAVLTGQRSMESALDPPNWEALAQLDTLVILMGFGAVSEIRNGLVAAGRNPDTPVLLVSAGTSPTQKTARTNLENLERAVSQGEWASPSLMLVGKVVEQWSDTAASPKKRNVVVVDRQEIGPTGIYPLTLSNMQSRTALVVGGGPVGTRKCRILLRSGAKVVLCCPTVTEELRARIKNKEITWLDRDFRASDLKGVFLVFAATNHPQLNNEIAKLAAQRHILCNVATSLNHGDFRVPALAHLGDCTIAFSSLDGQPRTAQYLRDQIEGYWFLGC